MTTVRTKFRVNSVTKYDGIGVRLELFSVVNQNGNSGKKSQSWNATPTGKIELQINNLSAAQQFEPGKEFYVDFTEVVNSTNPALDDLMGQP